LESTTVSALAAALTEVEAEAEADGAGDELAGESAAALTRVGTEPSVPQAVRRTAAQAPVRRRLMVIGMDPREERQLTRMPDFGAGDQRTGRSLLR
jgi:hypothetical protein